MGWKVGNKINIQARPQKVYVTYKYKLPGEEKDYLAPNYPWNDSVWMSKWTFKSQRAQHVSGGQALALRVEDEKGVEVTSSIIDNPDLCIKAQCRLLKYHANLTNSLASSVLFCYSRGNYHKQTYTDCIAAIKADKSHKDNYINISTRIESGGGIKVFLV